MSDLISREEVLNLIDYMFEHERDLIKNVWVRDSIKEVIKEKIPPAYNVANVIKELEENSSNFKKVIYYSDGSKHHRTRKAVSLNKAIEIVNKGGVTND